MVRLQYYLDFQFDNHFPAPFLFPKLLFSGRQSDQGRLWRG